MTKLQFRVLYREFLFRTVDLEVLSAQGDPSKLLGQFAMLLTLFSLWASATAFFFQKPGMSRAEMLIAAWPYLHFLIATTMLVVGLFAVLSWDSTFPDRRDVLILAPLPVRAGVIFRAKVAALATGLGVSVGVLNAFPSLTWPLALSISLGSLIRAAAAYWIAMFSAGAFVYCCVLALQGLAALLPRRIFLHLSAWLQMGAFGLLITGYFLEPSLSTPAALAGSDNQQVLAWLPSYWFLALFQTLNGSSHPALAPLAHRAWTGVAIAGITATAAFVLSYFRTLRKIVEEPDITPGFRGWPLRFGSQLQTAILQFSVRTLLRSRPHRVILAFYFAVAFALIVAIMKPLLAHWRFLLHQVNVPILFSTVVATCFTVVGIRVVFSMPVSLKANWIFRMTAVRQAAEYLSATRRSLFALSSIPVWMVCAMLLFSIWPWQLAAVHLAVIALLGSILNDLCLHGFQKIPFTCSYLPGKLNVYRAFICVYALFPPLIHGLLWEQRALQQKTDLGLLLLSLGVVAALARWRTGAAAKRAEAVLLFEDTQPAQVQGLGLYRDGILPFQQR